MTDTFVPPWTERFCVGCARMRPYADYRSGGRERVKTRRLCRECRATERREADAARGAVTHGPRVVWTERECTGCGCMRPRDDYRMTYWSLARSRDVTIMRRLCRECRASAQRVARAANGANTTGPRVVWTERVCPGCDCMRPRDDFRTGNGKWAKTRQLCRDCRQAAGRALNAARGAMTRGSLKSRRLKRSAPPVEVQAVIDSPPALEYLCRTCGAVRVASAGRLCSACLTAQYARNDQSRRVERKEHGKPGISVTPGLFWSAPPRCNGCGKHIFESGRCYTCATGNKRVILRWEEREAIEAPHGPPPA